MRFVDCQFRNVNLSGCSLTSSSFRNCQFSDSKMVGMNWSSCNGLSDLKFSQCLLNHNVFQLTKINFFEFIDCELKDCDFSEASLKNVDFTGSNLEGSFFSRTNLENANFTRASKYSLDITQNSIKGAGFSYPDVLALLAPFEIKINS